MAWRDNLRTASYRGVTFYIKSHTAGGGRRTVNHEYPLRDKNSIEDLGLKSRSFQLDAYVLGNDYMSDRDALISALEQNGSGLLIHPYLGEKTVHCDSYSLRESADAGRMAEFSLTFIEDGLKSQPSGSINSGAIIESQSGDLIDAISQSYIDNVKIDGVSEFVRDGARLSIQDYGAILSSIQSSGIFSTAASSQDLINSSANLINMINTFQNYDSTAILDSETTAKSVVNSISTVYNLAPDYDTKTALMQDLQALEITMRSETTANIIYENANKKAVKDLVDFSAIAYQARSVQANTYSSYDDAIAARLDLTERLDEKIKSSGDDTFNLLRSLKAQVVKSVPASGEDLPNISNVRYAQRQSALLASYKNYGDASRESEIVTRNDFEHPGFMPAQTDIEVLI